MKRQQGVIINVEAKKSMMKRRESSDYWSQVHQAAAHLRRKFHWKKGCSAADLAIVLGSGLGGFSDVLTTPREIPFSMIPHFPASGVSGHAGALILGMLEGRQVLCLKGRVHLYEGHDLLRVTFAVRVLGHLGITKMIFTNAAGGINAAFHPGDLMLIEDHISTFFPNPLLGKNLDLLGPRFPDMSAAYSPRLRKLAAESARRLRLKLKKGIYVAVTGPSYESPAEIQMFKRLGADAVGMSTVPEVIVARHMGIECLGISIITNLASGISKKSLNHVEVLEAGEKVKPRLTELLREICRQINKNPGLAENPLLD